MLSRLLSRRLRIPTRSYGAKTNALLCSSAREQTCCAVQCCALNAVRLCCAFNAVRSMRATQCARPMRAKNTNALTEDFKNPHRKYVHNLHLLTHAQSILYAQTSLISTIPTYDARRPQRIE